MMMAGTAEASIPMNLLLWFSESKASTGLLRVWRPIAISVIRRIRPNRRTTSIYVTRNVPPPCWAASVGNLQMFPRPTAEAAVARMNPLRPLKSPLSLKRTTNLNHANAGTGYV